MFSMYQISEKLDPNQKIVVTSSIPSHWNFYYTKGLLVLYEDLPDLELTRKIISYSISDGVKEIDSDKEKYILIGISPHLSHWQCLRKSIVKSSLLLKGTNCVLIISCFDYADACRVLCKIKKKLIS